MAGPRPNRNATKTTHNKNNITMLAKSKRSNIGAVSTVVAMQASMVQPYAGHGVGVALRSGSPSAFNTDWMRRTVELVPTSSKWRSGAEAAICCAKPSTQCRRRRCHPRRHAESVGVDRPSTKVAQFNCCACSSKPSRTALALITAVCPPSSSASLRTDKMRFRCAAGRRCKLGVST